MCSVCARVLLNLYSLFEWIFFALRECFLVFTLTIASFTYSRIWVVHCWAGTFFFYPNLAAILNFYNFNVLIRSVIVLHIIASPGSAERKLLKKEGQRLTLCMAVHFMVFTFRKAWCNEIYNISFYVPKIFVH